MEQAKTVIDVARAERERERELPVAEHLRLSKHFLGAAAAGNMTAPVEEVTTVVATVE
jgi:hypothetical protein